MEDLKIVNCIVLGIVLKYIICIINLQLSFAKFAINPLIFVLKNTLLYNVLSCFYFNYTPNKAVTG